ncbi:MAG: PD-(D/E)XK nuclease family protein [Candidatus Omnitrophota bacterium]|jgi:RecB family exonuclease|nr:MAG: PD-(D/E)XK nuclease family protein [Candidatus Omnitrophota bacterium]
MKRKCILHSHPFQKLTAQEDRIPLTHNPCAARALEIPHQSLRSLAQTLLFRNRMGVAPELTANRLLRQAVQQEMPTDDVIGAARSISLALRMLFQAGVSLQELEKKGTMRARQLARTAQIYRNLLREINLVDGSEWFWEAAKFGKSDAAIGIYGYPRLGRDEMAFIESTAADASELVLPGLDHPAFAENRNASSFFKEHGWDIRWESRSSLTLGERLSEKFLGLCSQNMEFNAHEYPYPEAEARGTLAQIKQRMILGIAPDHMAIVVRNESLYVPTLQSVAWEYQVPLRILQDTPLTETQLGAWIALLFQAIQNNLAFETTARLLRHPLGPGIAETMWDESRRQHSSGLEKWRTAHTSLSLLEWPQQDSRNNYIQKLRDVLETFELRRRTAHWAREAIAFYKLQDGLQEMTRTPDHVVNRSTFFEETTELLSLLAVPVSPGRGGVELHTPQSCAGARFAHVFLIGAAEGILPAAIHDDFMLDFHDREALAQSGIVLDNAMDTALRESQTIWSTLQTVTDSFTLSYPKLIGRDERLPSKLFDLLGASPSLPPSLPASSVEEGRKYFLQQNSGMDDAALAYAHRAWTIESRREGDEPYDEFDGIVGYPVPPDSLTFSATQLTTLGQCPFKWFAQKILGLKESEEAEEELRPGMKGKLCHQTLKIVLERVKECENPRSAALEILAEVLPEAEKLENLPPFPVWDAQRKEILTLLQNAINGEDFLRTEAVVLAAEQKFTGSWFGLNVQGYVDRIDRGLDGLIFIDYKTSASPPPGAKNAISKAKLDIQLPLYVQTAASCLYPSEQVAGAYYYSLPKAVILKQVECSQEQKWDSELGIFVNEVKKTLENGFFPVQPDVDCAACAYCPYDAVCRRGIRLARKGGTA